MNWIRIGNDRITWDFYILCSTDGSEITRKYSLYQIWIILISLISVTTMTYFRMAKNLIWPKSEVIRPLAKFLFLTKNICPTVSSSLRKSSSKLPIALKTLTFCANHFCNWVPKNSKNKRVWRYPKGLGDQTPLQRYQKLAAVFYGLRRKSRPITNRLDSKSTLEPRHAIVVPDIAARKKNPSCSFFCCWK